jgi:preprotein translocase subunit SecF
MNIMKFRPIFFLISLSLLALSAFSIIRWRFKASIDFAGGTIWEFKLPSVTDKSKIETIFKSQNITPSTLSLSADSWSLKAPPLDQNQKTAIESELKKLSPGYHELRFESLGPVLGKELLTKTVVAIVLSSLSLLLFIASRFQDPIFGTAAVLAMLHDTFILVGSFSLFGHYFGAELDALFVTALLTTLSASVHDTVVTFDRIRELKRHSFQLDWVSLANQAVTETLVRSINNSMTIIFMLLSLVLLGGPATRWFATALLVGVVAGTYSSTAVAIPLVLFWKGRSTSKSRSTFA